MKVPQELPDLPPLTVVLDRQRLRVVRVARSFVLSLSTFG